MLIPPLPLIVFDLRVLEDRLEVVGRGSKAFPPVPTSTSSLDELRNLLVRIEPLLLPPPFPLTLTLPGAELGCEDGSVDARVGECCSPLDPEWNAEGGGITGLAFDFEMEDPDRFLPFSFKLLRRPVLLLLLLLLGLPSVA